MSETEGVMFNVRSRFHLLVPTILLAGGLVAYPSGREQAAQERQPASTRPAAQPAQPAEPQRPTQPPASPTDVQPPQPVFRTDVEVVAMDVSVVDRNGRPVRGLKPEDFVVKVDGVQRTLVQAEFVTQDSKAGPPPSEQYSTNEGAYGGRLIMFVVDSGNIRPGRGGPFIRSANKLLDDLGPGDRVGLAVIPGGQVVDFTNHLALVRERLTQVTGAATTRSGPQRMSLSESLDIVERNDARALDDAASRECTLIFEAAQIEACRQDLVNEATQRVQFAHANTQASLTALRRLFQQLQRIPGTKTLVLLSEGLVLPRSVQDVAWVPQEASDAKVSLYALRLDDTFVDATMQRPSPKQSDDRQLLMEGLSTLVGMARGAAFEVSLAGSEGTFTRLSRELTGYYIVAFEADPSEYDGKPHRFSVEVNRPGVEIRTRREFVANPRSTAKRTDEQLLAESLRDPLLASEILMRVATYNFPDPETGKVRVLVVAGLGRGGDELGIKTVGFKVTDREENLVTSRLEEVEIRKSADHRHMTTLVLAPGTYTLKLAGVDAEGRRGSVEHRFDAGLSTQGALVTGDLMLADTSAAQQQDSMVPLIEPNLRSGVVTGHVELLSADVQRLATAAVQLEIATEPNAPSLAGRALQVMATKQQQRRVAQGHLDLAALPPGEYVARAVVAIEGKPVTRLIRNFVHEPSSETRARSFSAMLGATGGSPVRFDRRQVLQPDVAGYFLQQVETALQASPSPQLSTAVQLAREGRFGELPDAVPASRDEDDAAGAFLRGLGLYARGELEPAAAEFRRSLRASSEFVPATFYLGACYAAGGRDKEAVGAWQTTLASDDGTANPAVFEAATDAYLRLNDAEAALDVASEALAAFPDHDSLRLRIVRAHAGTGKYAEGLEALRPYLERHPENHEALLLAMRLIYELNIGAAGVGDAADQRALFERYLRAYTQANGPQAVLAQQWLKALHARWSSGL